LQSNSGLPVPKQCQTLLSSLSHSHSLTHTHTHTHTHTQHKPPTNTHTHSTHTHTHTGHTLCLFCLAVVTGTCKSSPSCQLNRVLSVLNYLMNEYQPQGAGNQSLLSSYDHEEMMA